MKRLISLLFFCGISAFLYSQIKIEMEKEGGVYKVPCEVNGLKLQFIFDTGASVVSLSNSVAEFMLKNGYLNPDDIYDAIELKQADGSSFTSHKVLIKHINIGGSVLHDVVGVITPHQDAPLLLGQSAIQKLGKISIKGNFLIIDKTDITEYSGSEREISFLGLTQWSSYEECYDKLCERYGDSKVLRNTNNGQPTLYIEKMFFNHILFDEIELYFDEGYLNSVELRIHYPKKDINVATKKRDEISRLYSKKYTSVKKGKSSKGFIYYSIGYVERKNPKDWVKNPISIDIIDSTLQNLIDDEWVINEYYDVVVTYWQESHKRLYEKNPPQEDEY